MRETIKKPVKMGFFIAMRKLFKKIKKIVKMVLTILGVDDILNFVVERNKLMTNDLKESQKK